jgi:para-nitrobenzyl esterase
MMSYWAEFADTGSPGRGRAGDLPEWRPWDDSSADAPKYIVFDTPADGGVRLASETVSLEEVVAAIGADPRLDTPVEKCAVMRNLVAWDYIPVDAYAQANGAICNGYALDAYPWKDMAARD